MHTLHTMISILNPKYVEKCPHSPPRGRNKPSDTVVLFDIMVASTSSGEKNFKGRSAQLPKSNSSNRKLLQQNEILKPKNFIANIKKKKKTFSTLKKMILLVS